MYRYVGTRCAGNESNGMEIPVQIQDTRKSGQQLDTEQPVSCDNRILSLLSQGGWSTSRLVKIGKRPKQAR